MDFTTALICTANRSSPLTTTRTNTGGKTALPHHGDREGRFFMPLTCGDAKTAAVGFFSEREIERLRWVAGL
jgi:hypothetical protein